MKHLGGYEIAERGIVNLKGKGLVRTYWLLNKTDTITQSNNKSLKSLLKTSSQMKRSLNRCDSSESTKKIRYATGNVVENCGTSIYSKKVENVENKKDHACSTSCPSIKHSANLLSVAHSQTNYSWISNFRSPQVYSSHSAPASPTYQYEHSK